MPDYEKMYYTLFNKITDTIELLEKETAELRRIQIQTEEDYISRGIEETRSDKV